jgi:NADPH2:quinone reductase
VQGGSSGIGVTAIQIAHALGFRVFATAGTADKCRACEALGAERAINYKTEDFVEVVKSLTHDRGVDVILDMVGAAYLPRELSALGRRPDRADRAARRREGRDQPGRDPAPPLTVTGSTLRPRPVEFKARIAAQLKARVWPLLADGRIKPVIYRVLPAGDAAQAHALMESGEHIGKIVLDWGAIA